MHVSNHSADSSLEHRIWCTLCHLHGAVFEKQPPGYGYIATPQASSSILLQRVCNVLMPADATPINNMALHSLNIHRDLLNEKESPGSHEQSMVRSQYKGSY